MEHEVKKPKDLNEALAQMEDPTANAAPETTVGQASEGMTAPTNDEVKAALSKLYGKDVYAFTLGVAFEKDDSNEDFDVNFKNSGESVVVFWMIDELHTDILEKYPELALAKIMNMLGK